MADTSVKLTKTQVDHLGDRLRNADPTEDDLRLLDWYRRSFGEAYEFVVRLIRDEIGFDPTGRPVKSTPAIRDKLKRETIRLTQMQDIAGCRLVVEDIQAQEAAVRSINGCFSDVEIDDRRQRPSHGYRAVHLIVEHGGKPVEVQIRTKLQHQWAELSEKLANDFDPGIKYGTGPRELIVNLGGLSAEIAHLEKLLATPSGGLSADDQTAWVSMLSAYRSHVDLVIDYISKTKR